MLFPRAGDIRAHDHLGGLPGRSRDRFACKVLRQAAKDDNGCCYSMSGSLPDPDGYGGFAGSDSRGDGDSEDEFDRIIRQSKQKVHKPKSKAQGSNEKRAKFLMGMNIAGASCNFTNNVRIPDNIPYSPVGEAEPILNDTRSSMKKGLDEAALKSRSKTYQRTFDRPTSYRQDLDSVHDGLSEKQPSRKKRKKLKVQKLGESREKQERLQQHQENFIKRKRKASDHRKSYEKDSPFSNVNGYFLGSKRHDDQRSGVRRQRDKSENSKFIARKSRDRKRSNQGRKMPAAPEVVDLIDDDDSDNENNDSTEPKARVVTRTLNMSPKPFKPSILGTDSNLHYFDYLLLGENVFTPNFVTVKLLENRLVIDIDKKALIDAEENIAFFITADDIQSWTYGDEKAPKIGDFQRLVQITLSKKDTWTRLRERDAYFPKSFPRQCGIRNSIFFVVGSDNFDKFKLAFEQFKCTESELGQLMATNVYWKSIEVIDDGILMDVGQAISEYVKNYNMSPNGGSQRKNDHADVGNGRRYSPRLKNLRENVGSSSSVATRTRNSRRRGRATGPPETLFKYPFPPKKMKVTITVSAECESFIYCLLKLTCSKHFIRLKPYCFPRIMTLTAAKAIF